jgi:hypothetical protein
VAVRLRAEGHKVQNIEAANAIEALAYLLALSQNQWQRDARVRGALKLRGKNDLSFAAVRQRTFYVTQPMRMATIQPLLALGLVESTAERFNAFRCSSVGEQFIAESCSLYNPYNRTVLEQLNGWASGRHDNVATDPLRKALSPLEPLPTTARHLLRDFCPQVTPLAEPRLLFRLLRGRSASCRKRLAATSVRGSGLSGRPAPGLRWRAGHCSCRDLPNGVAY